MVYLEGMTRQQRREKWATKVAALERIMAKPLSYEESIYFGNRLAEADAKLQATRTKKEIERDRMMATGGMQ